MFGRRRRGRTAVPGEGMVVGPADAVEGTVSAEALTIEGRFDGTLTVATALVVAPAGRVAGAVRAARLVIEPGAVVRARCRIGARDADAETP